MNNNAKAQSTSQLNASLIKPEQLPIEAREPPPPPLQQQQQQSIEQFNEQSTRRIEQYQDEIDQLNYHAYLEQMQNAQTFGALLRESDRRAQQMKNEPNISPFAKSSSVSPHQQQYTDIHFSPSEIVLIFNHKLIIIQIILLRFLEFKSPNIPINSY